MAVVPGAEIATILRLQMVARLVWAMQAKHAICEFAEVRLIDFYEGAACSIVSMQALYAVPKK